MGRGYCYWSREFSLVEDLAKDSQRQIKPTKNTQLCACRPVNSCIGQLAEGLAAVSRADPCRGTSASSFMPSASPPAAAALSADPHAIPVSRADLLPNQLHGTGANRRRYEEFGRWSSSDGGVKRSTRLVHPQRPFLAMVGLMCCVTIFCLWMSLRRGEGEAGAGFSALRSIRTAASRSET